MRGAAAVGSRLSDAIDLRDVVVFGGLAAIVYGVSLVHEPSAWIVGGSAAFGMGVFGVPRR